MPEPIRVMVVDDDPAMCEFLIDFLGRRGYGAEPVQNAEQAVERFERSPPAAYPFWSCRARAARQLSSRP